MNRQSLLFTLFFLCSYLSSFGQVSPTAHEYILPYTDGFHFGINPGSHTGWTDDQLADIARQIGINTFRPALPESFLEYWGYDIRLEAFQHYQSIGMEDITVFIGYPAPEHREDSLFCEGAVSEVFINLYEPIWIEENGEIKINPENYFAQYCYQLAQTYQDYITFYEIWNEPDFSFTVKAVEPPGTDGELVGVQSRPLRPRVSGALFFITCECCG